MHSVWCKRFAFLLALVPAVMAGSAAMAASQPPFMSIKGPTTQPVGHYDFCATHKSECGVITSRDVRVRFTDARWKALVAINDRVNKTIVATTDQEMFGRPEVWAYPTVEGDCEDFVLLKQKLLVRQGWPVGALLITVVRQPNGDGHAVLTVRTDRGDLVLDNLNSRIVLWNETPYHFIKRQSDNDTGKWVSIQDGRGDVEVGSLKN